MLLTSSQVSVAISCFVIFLFTLALFLSGYVVQQSTLRGLRAAIAPELQRVQPQLVSFEGLVEREQGMGDLALLEREDRSEGGVSAGDGEKTDGVLKRDLEMEERLAPQEGMSRAERRKLIKQQILLEGQGEGFKGYKRRAW